MWTWIEKRHHLPTQTTGNTIAMSLYGWWFLIPNPVQKTITCFTEKDVFFGFDIYHSHH